MSWFFSLLNTWNNTNTLDSAKQVVIFTLLLLVQRRLHTLASLLLDDYHKLIYFRINQTYNKYFNVFRYQVYYNLIIQVLLLRNPNRYSFVIFLLLDKFCMVCDFFLLLVEFHKVVSCSFLQALLFLDKAYIVY